MAGVTGLEPTTNGFEVRCSTNWTTPLYGDLYGIWTRECMRERHVCWPLHQQAMAPSTRFELVTNRLTADCSTTELTRQISYKDYLIILKKLKFMEVFYALFHSIMIKTVKHHTCLIFCSTSVFNKINNF